MLDLIPVGKCKLRYIPSDDAENPQNIYICLEVSLEIDTDCIVRLQTAPMPHVQGKELNPEMVADMQDDLIRALSRLGRETITVEMLDF